MTTYEYVFYEIDESFEFCGCWGNEICYQWASHGFEISDDENSDYDIKTLKGYGHYTEISNIETLEELIEYLRSHLNEVQETKTYTKDQNIKRFENLIKFIVTQLEEKQSHDENIIKKEFHKRRNCRISRTAM